MSTTPQTIACFIARTYDETNHCYKVLMEQTQNPRQLALPHLFNTTPETVQAMLAGFHVAHRFAMPHGVTIYILELHSPPPAGQPLLARTIRVKSTDFTTLLNRNAVTPSTEIMVAMLVKLLGSVGFAFWYFGLTTPGIRTKLTLAGDCCPICLDADTAAAHVWKLPCNHRAHEHCIAKWLARSRSCPVCRARF